METEFRHLPSVDKILSDKRLKQLERSYSHLLLVDLIRQQLECERRSIAAGNPRSSIDEIIESVCAQVRALENPSLRPVINAAGVILHTNLGRAPLSKESLVAMDDAS
ncbi:L-seryl-tRNA(Sec) selenium transferase, partial [Chloroflexota bacterium]